jgi:hypothetical protein
VALELVGAAVGAAVGRHDGHGTCQQVWRAIPDKLWRSSRTRRRIVLPNGLQTVMPTVGADGHAGCGTVGEDSTRAVRANIFM